MLLDDVCESLRNSINLHGHLIFFFFKMRKKPKKQSSASLVVGHNILVHPKTKCTRLENNDAPRGGSSTPGFWGVTGECGFVFTSARVERRWEDKASTASLPGTFTAPGRETPGKRTWSVT